MAKLYADENFPYPVVEELRRLGHDVLTIQDDGRANQRVTDETVLSVAIQLGRAILTTNRRHFMRLHMLSTEHEGIIVCTYSQDFVDQAKRIHEQILNVQLSSQLIRVNRSA